MPTALHSVAMPASGDGTARRVTIAYELSNPGNARLLDRVLSAHYRLMPGQATADSDDAFDLLIVDPGGLERARSRLCEARARAAPTVLPVLLLAAAGQAPESWVRRELGRTVDDVLRIPTTGLELIARIDNLLRLRELSRLQEETSLELRDVVRALATLNTCDEILVRAREEGELLDRICRAIVETEGYRLAWVGFAMDNEEHSVEVRAAAGPARTYLDGLDIHWREGVVANAMRSGETQVIDDISQDPAVSIDRSRPRSFDLHSVIMLPLPVEKDSPGCLAIYSNRLHCFSDESRELLERLAGNLTFGLKALRVYRESRRQATEIESLAYSDALTGLPNRQYFLDRLDERLALSRASGTPGAVLFIDLNLFKMVNDALGHHVGDEVLRRVGNRLRWLVRGSDLVARHGGDEFVIALFGGGGGVRRETSPEAFEKVVRDTARRILAHLREPIVLGEHEHRLGASIGISLFPEHGLEAELLLERADVAMYEAKKGDTGHICRFTDDILERRQHRLTLEGRLYRAINRGELILHYQPICRLSTGEIIGVEALVRWPQEDGNLLSPAAFLPVAEETGMIAPLGEWVLETAARQLREWDDGKHALKMMVNLSLRQLHPDNDIESFARIVGPYVHPSRIELEVTEGMLMSDPPTIEAKLKVLHEHGFGLAIDDFGTGYSSLSRIKDLPFHSLKIDRRFVAGIGHSDKLEPVTQTILQLAENLSLCTIAEGIENAQQKECLTRWGCDYGQGFWFSPPLPPSELEELLRGGGVL